MRRNTPSVRKRCTQPGAENAKVMTAQKMSIAMASGMARESHSWWGRFGVMFY
jgi:hypothetical protein